MLVRRITYIACKEIFLIHTNVETEKSERSKMLNLIEIDRKTNKRLMSQIEKKFSTT